MSGSIVQLLPVPDAEILYDPAFAAGRAPAALLNTLIERVPWRSQEIVLWGKRHAQPRLMAWFGDPGATYTYSRLRLEPVPWIEPLRSLRREVERSAEAQFNSVLANYYRDERDSMGMHSDDEPELGPRPVIASLSLGERRTFVLKHKSRKNLARVRLVLEPGSLLIMKGATQANWTHGIDKERRPCGPRINLTFRRVSSADQNL